MLGNMIEGDELARRRGQFRTKRDAQAHLTIEAARALVSNGIAINTLAEAEAAIDAMIADGYYSDRAAAIADAR